MDYNYLKTLIPKDKFDISSIPVLMEISEEDVQPILPELFTWIADMNWPVAKEMIWVLPRFSQSLLPLVKETLQPSENDDMFKYFIITELLPALPANIQLELLVDISRIANNPTDDEKYSALNAAKRYISKLNRP